MCHSFAIHSCETLHFCYKCTSDQTWPNSLLPVVIFVGWRLKEAKVLSELDSNLVNIRSTEKLLDFVFKQPKPARWLTSLGKSLLAEPGLTPKFPLLTWASYSWINLVYLVGLLTIACPKSLDFIFASSAANSRLLHVLLDICRRPFEVKLIRRAIWACQLPPIKPVQPAICKQELG